MKNKRFFALLMVAVMTISALALAACGSKTLEEYVKSDSKLDSEIKNVAQQNGLEITVKDNTLTYIYKYQEKMTDDQIKQMATQIDTALESAKATFQNLAAEMETKTKIKGITVAVEYQDASGKVITKKEFTSK